MTESLPGAGFLGYGVVRLAQLLGRQMQRRLAPLELTATSFSALFHLAHRPDISAAALARLILITPQSVGPLLDGLAGAGLVRRHRDGGPGTPIRTELTAVGRDRLVAARAVVEELDAELTEGLPPDTAALLAAHVHAVVEQRCGEW